MASVCRSRTGSKVHANVEEEALMTVGVTPESVATVSGGEQQRFMQN